MNSWKLGKYGETGGTALDCSQALVRLIILQISARYLGMVQNLDALTCLILQRLLVACFR